MVIHAESYYFMKARNKKNTYSDKTQSILNSDDKNPAKSVTSDDYIPRAQKYFIPRI